MLNHRNSGILENTHGRFRHFSRCTPHGIVNNNRLAFIFAACPFAISINNGRNFFFSGPDTAMRRGNHFNIKSEASRRIQSFFGLHAVREQNIGIIAFGFLHDAIKRRIFNKQSVAGVVLTETVIGKQQFVFLNISHHRIRPVQHRGGHKLKRPFADVQTVTGFDNMIIPACRIKMSFQRHFSGRVGDNRRLRRQFHQFGNIT